jgi:ligand-binding sensor domain-containing protein
MKKFIFILGIIILSFDISFSAIGDWTTYTNMNYVQEMTIQQNYIWCATTGGIFTFNLQDSSIAKLTNADGLGGNVLYSLAIDTSGVFWFGADNGTLSKYISTSGNWTIYDDFYDSEKGGLKLNYILPDGDKLWVASNIGISLFLIYHNGGEIKETYKRLGENINIETEVNCVHLAGDRIWAGTAKGIAFADKNDSYLQDHTHWTSFTESTSPGLRNDFVYCITNIGEQVYAGTKAGVFHFISSDSSWEEVVGLGNREVRDLKYINGYLFAATDNGVYRYDSGSWAYLSSSGLLSNNLNYIVMDSSSNLWVGTQVKGIAKYNQGTSSWQSYVIDGPPGNIFKDITIDYQGRIWCAQSPYKASSFDGTNWTTYDSILNLLMGGNGIERLKEYPDGNLWFGSWGGGLIKKDILGNWSKYDNTNSPLKGISNDPNYVVVFGTTVDVNGNIWFANREGLDGTLLLAMQKGVDSDWAIFNKSLGFPANTINYIMAKDNHLWACFREGGITDFKFAYTAEGKVCTTYSCRQDYALKTYNTTKGLPSDEVITCNFDKDGVLWVGTSAGLCYYNGIYDRFIKFALPDSQGPQVNTIVVDERNRKWIGTIKGFCILEDNQFIGNYYFPNSKLAGPYVNKIVINSFSGDVWIATETGLSKYQYGLGSAEDDLSLVRVHPNPFVLKERGDKLTFDRLPYQVRIKIYTPAGELVKEINSGDQWDGTNQADKLVASGIYLFYVFDQQGRSAVGKIALIRE